MTKKEWDALEISDPHLFVAKMKEALSVAINALEFYASGKTWESDYMSGNCKLQSDQGKRAIEALKVLKPTEAVK